MTPDMLLKQGDLEGALAALQTQVRRAPEDAALRVFLFQLLCVLGLWDRAVRQLKTAATLDPSADAMAQTYRAAIVCERRREAVFAGQAEPRIIGEPQAWVAWLAEALKRDAVGDHQAADALRERAFDAAPAVAGAVNGAPFEWIADSDPRLGPLFEIIVNGQYFWAPFHAFRSINAEAPSDLRDVVWTPVRVVWANGGQGVGLTPTRYAAPARAYDDAHRLARATRYLSHGVRTICGVGQRTFTTNDADVALMDLRALTLDVAMRDGGPHG